MWKCAAEREKCGRLQIYRCKASFLQNFTRCGGNKAIVLKKRTWALLCFHAFRWPLHQISRNGWPVDRLKTKEHLDFLILSTWTEALFYSGTTSATQNILRSPLHYPVTGAHDGLLPVIIDMSRIECIHENHTCYYHFRSNRKTSWMTN